VLCFDVGRRVRVDRPGGHPARPAGQRESFVSVSKPTSPSIAAARKSELGAFATSTFLNPGNGDDFYIAINKKELGKEWFLSGYLRQYYPGAPVDMGAARSLGTRVVSFKVQNGKLFVFDVARNKIFSDLFESADPRRGLPDRDQLRSVRGAGQRVAVRPLRPVVGPEQVRRRQRELLRLLALGLGLGQLRHRRLVPARLPQAV
jgi:hypothetical protein